MGAAKTFVVTSINPHGGVSTSGIGTSKLTKSSVHLTGETIGVTSITYDSVSGIATVNTRNNHGLKTKCEDQYSHRYCHDAGLHRKLYHQAEQVSTSFTVDVGAGATISEIAIGSSMFAHRGGFASNGW